MNILVLRFSAMGDVALAQPVIKQILSQNANVEITLVTKPEFAPLFAGLPRFKFFGANFKSDFKGLSGLVKLQKQLLTDVPYDSVVDLHDVVRTWVLCFLLSIKGVPYKRIDKDRASRKKLTRKNNKVFKPIKHTSQKYLDVFRQLGLQTGDLSDLYSGPSPMPLHPGNRGKALLDAGHFLPKDRPWVGLAPFSKHPQKEWPLEKIKILIKALTDEKKFRVLLFGGGKEEISRLKHLAGDNNDVLNLAGSLNLAEEMEVVRQLDLMITMDSFNMHLAGLLGVKIVSIWGATHPYAGFGPLGKNEKYLVQIPHQHLPCRPCSIFGNRPCWRGDFACMQQITPDMVMEKITLALSANL
ncbi:glycosyltransferase family 9 protein [Fulvivirgaceae bacterium BMA12]|uniref:Glycosyltransferase family 9 protein n=1 Tax=Agaribacillus aureus TaxID=3051825 RepID=A0ABT8LDL9_9BACT|nr:glycosyltransferase family 9 protein [Fulvivirgaceae bacterium BMA12]